MSKATSFNCLCDTIITKTINNLIELLQSRCNYLDIIEHMKSTNKVPFTKINDNLLEDKHKRNYDILIEYLPKLKNLQYKYIMCIENIIIIVNRGDIN